MRTINPCQPHHQPEGGLAAQAHLADDELAVALGVGALAQVAHHADALGHVAS